jgi:hypothetical protein
MTQATMLYKIVKMFSGEVGICGSTSTRGNLGISKKYRAKRKIRNKIAKQSRRNNR